MSNMSLTGYSKFIFLLVLAVVTLLIGYILRPFFFAIFWAVLLAAFFAPLNRRLCARFSSPNLCAGITLAAVLVVLILPVGLILFLLIGESLELYNTVNAKSGSLLSSLSGLINAVGQHPLVARFELDHSFVADKSAEALKAAANFIVRNLSALTENTILFFIQFAVMLYSLFYFLRDGKHLMGVITAYLPVDKRHADTFISEFMVTSKATLKFTFVIGGIQGLLGGLVFFITGIESPLVWGVLMVGLSIVPAIGNAVIWAPAGVVMLLTGHIWQGLLILIFGFVVISSVDNLLRPVLMGKDIQMHPLLIFLSTLGGLAVFGFSGFVLGPVVAAFFLAAWKQLPDLYSREAEK